MNTEAFCRRLREDCRLAPGSHVLVAVSGGADSTALLCFFCEAREAYPLRVSCAHVEHGIRGEASVEDMHFVRALCDELNVPMYAARVDAPGYARAHGCGMEDAARTLRYGFLRETAKEIGAQAIALAHHQQDQAETLLLHAARGCDVRGLCAMRARRGDLIRPLLDETPQALRDALIERGQTWREDATNGDLCCARNRVRLSVLPELALACPGAQAALCRLARAAQRDEDYFDAQLSALGRCMPLADGAAMARAALDGAHAALVGRALVRLADAAGVAPQSAQTIERIADALAGGKQAVVNLAGGARASLGRTYICMTREDAPVADTPLMAQGKTVTPFGAFTVRDARPGETGDGVTARRSRRSD